MNDYKQHNRTSKEKKVIRQNCQIQRIIFCIFILDRDEIRYTLTKMKDVQQPATKI